MMCFIGIQDATKVNKIQLLICDVVHARNIQILFSKPGITSSTRGTTNLSNKVS